MAKEVVAKRAERRKLALALGYQAASSSSFWSSHTANAACPQYRFDSPEVLKSATSFFALATRPVRVSFENHGLLKSGAFFDRGRAIDLADMVVP